MLRSMGLQRVGHDLATEHTTHKIKISQKRWDSVSILLLLLSRFSRVQLCVTPEMAAHQAPPSLGFSRQGYWSGLPFPPPGVLPNPGIEPVSPEAPALQADSLPLSHRESPSHWHWPTETLSVPVSAPLIQVSAVCIYWGRAAHPHHLPINGISLS